MVAVIPPHDNSCGEIAQEINRLGQGHVLLQSCSNNNIFSSICVANRKMKHTDGGSQKIVAGQLRPNYSVSTITSLPIVDHEHISAISKGKIFFQEKERVLYFSLFTYHACPKCGFMSTNGKSLRKHIKASFKEKKVR